MLIDTLSKVLRGCRGRRATSCQGGLALTVARHDYGEITSPPSCPGIRYTAIYLCADSNNSEPQFTFMATTRTVRAIALPRHTTALPSLGFPANSSNDPPSHASHCSGDLQDPNGWIHGLHIHNSSPALDPFPSPLVRTGRRHQRSSAYRVQAWLATMQTMACPKVCLVASTAPVYLHLETCTGSQCRCTCLVRGGCRRKRPVTPAWYCCGPGQSAPSTTARQPATCTSVSPLKKFGAWIRSSTELSTSFRS